MLRGHGGPYDLIVGELRVPRIVLGALVGAALGLSGALVQTVTRNPLASPDVIGVGHGAAAATVLALATGTVASPGALPAVAVTGGLVAAALVYVLAWRHGMQPSRFVLTGVGIGVALSAVVQLYLTESELAEAEAGQAVADRQPQRARLGAGGAARPGSCSSRCPPWCGRTGRCGRSASTPTRPPRSASASTAPSSA